MKKPLRIVAALGGNALLQKNEKPCIKTQMNNAEKALSAILPIIKNNKVVITYGNGPQVGNILIRSEEADGKAYTLPLSVCGAQSQGEIAYVLESSLRNLFLKNNIKKQVASLVTMVEVDKHDTAFSNPTKPVGPFLTKQQADAMKKCSVIIKEDSGRGWRRVVPSPSPIKIFGEENINALIKMGVVVIAVGGGGIPVYRNRHNKSIYEGVDAVIDKDKASARLAIDINADIFIILTEVPCAYLNYKTKNQKPLGRITINEAKKYLAQCHFAEGSMKPKIGAAINFLEAGNSRQKNKKVIITDYKNITKAFSGKAGTTIIK